MIDELDLKKKTAYRVNFLLTSSNREFEQTVG